MGNKLWDKTLHNPAHTEFCYGFQESDGCYVVLSNVIAGGGYVSHVRNSFEDYWLAKFCITKPQAKANYTASSQTLCQNTCIEFINQSQNATSYQWLFPGGTPSSDASFNPPSVCYFNQGSYDVTLIATNTTETDTFTLSNFLTVYPQIQFTPILQIGDTLFSVPGYVNYEWFHENILIPGENNYFYTATAMGNYSVLVTDTNGCQALATKLQVIASTNKLALETIGFTANYFSGSLLINLNSSSSKTAAVEFTDVLGKIIYTENIILKNGNNIMLLPIENLSSGFYFIKIISKNQMITLKVFQD